MHSNFPDIYKDDNHKPEMAIALTDFEALCGFKSEEKLIHCLSSYECIKSSLSLHSFDLSTLTAKNAMDWLFIKLS